MQGIRALALLGALAALTLPAAASADFPYGVDGPHWHIPDGSGHAPNDFGDDWRLAASTGTDSSVYSNNPIELYGIRGAHVVDNGAAKTAWQITTGPAWLGRIERTLNPVLGKSLVVYTEKA